MDRFLDGLAKCIVAAREKVHDAFYDENGEVNIVTIVVLIAIAVVLAIAFRDKIAELLQKLFGTVDKNAGELDKPVTIK